VTTRECFRRLRQWSTDPSASSGLDLEEIPVSEGEGKGKIEKMAKKGDAMELAFDAFIKANGWGDTGDT